MNVQETYSDYPTSLKLAIALKYCILSSRQVVLSRNYTSYDRENSKHRIKYDDGDNENLDLTAEKWRLLSNQANFSRAFEILRSKLCESEFTLCTSHNYVVIIPTPDDPRFLESCRKEIQGLLDRGSYAVVNESDIPHGTTALWSRVHNSIKKDEYGNEKYKFRLIIEGHRDPEKGICVLQLG